jgi:hypothetical protein
MGARPRRRFSTAGFSRPVAPRPRRNTAGGRLDATDARPSLLPQKQRARIARLGQAPCARLMIAFRFASRAHALSASAAMRSASVRSRRGLRRPRPTAPAPPDNAPAASSRRRAGPRRDRDQRPRGRKLQIRRERPIEHRDAQPVRRLPPWTARASRQAQRCGEPRTIVLTRVERQRTASRSARSRSRSSRSRLAARLCATPSRAVASSFVNNCSRGEADTIDVGGASSGAIFAQSALSNDAYSASAHPRPLALCCATRCVVVERCACAPARSRRVSSSIC